MRLPALPSDKTYLVIIVTALLTAVATVVARQLTQLVIRGLGKLGRAGFEGAYRLIAPHNPFSISLKRYKRAVRRSSLARIENPVGPPVDVLLERAFAPLRLVSEQSSRSIDLFSHVTGHLRTVVLGGPGTGKTTLMKSLVQRAINPSPAAPFPDVVPVFIVLRKLAASGNSVEQQIIDTFAEYKFPRADQFVDVMLKKGKLLIVLDGLDEVGMNREAVSEAIRDFCEKEDRRANQNRVVVTCRESGYRTQDLRDVIPTLLRVEPFTNHHIRIFLSGWPEHHDRSALALYAMIQADPPIRDVCRNPLLLTILTGLYLESEHFEWPTSREHFYTSATAELLTSRPARRGIKQRYTADDKRRILEVASLSRLESVEALEDPEEIMRDDLSAAITTLRRDADVRELLTELVEVNGLLRQVGDDSYTFAHRTIQEYFAAREAARTRTVYEMLSLGEHREDFAEVILFYCALLHNIPQVHQLLDHYLDNGEVLFACRCLLNAADEVDPGRVARIAGALAEAARDPEHQHQATILLSSLSQRAGHAYDVARAHFQAHLETMLRDLDTADPGALRSALGTTPEATMQVVPALLRQEDPRWRALAVYLLTDIGTEEALDLLVRQLGQPGGAPERIAAGQVLADLFRTSPDAVATRANLLPPQARSSAWPLDEYLPGRIAVPIVGALAEGGSFHPRQGAFYCAARVLTGSSEGMWDDVGRLRKHWDRLPRDLRMRRVRLHFARALAGSSTVFLAIFFVVLAAFGVQGARGRTVALVSASGDLHQRIPERYFVRARAIGHGLGRVPVRPAQDPAPQPLSGRTRDILPGLFRGRQAAPDTLHGQAPIALRQLAAGRYYPLFSAGGRDSLWHALPRYRGAGSGAAAVRSLAAIADSVDGIAGPPRGSRVWIPPFSRAISLLYLVVCVVIGTVVLRARRRRGDESTPAHEGLSRVAIISLVLFTAMVLTVLAGAVQGTGWLLFVPFVLPICCAFAGYLLEHIEIPHNRCIPFVEELIESAGQRGARGD